MTGVGLRVYSLEAGGQSVVKMTPAATDVDCYQPGLEQFTCDYWAYTLPNAEPDNLWYRFIVTDGTDTDYYDDNTPALDGGLGATTDDQEDNSYALMVYEPAFDPRPGRRMPSSTRSSQIVSAMAVRTITRRPAIFATMTRC